MANVRKFLFMNPSEGFAQEQASSDELALAKITLSGTDGVAIDVGGQLISNLAGPVNANDAARKVDVTTALTSAQSYADGIVATEQAARIAADEALTAAVSAEVTARTNADTAITTAYEAADDAEESARIAADSALQSGLTAEQSARISADNSLTAAVSAEASARASADTQLGLDIDAEEAARVAADSSIRADFAAADDALETDYIARDVVVLDTAKAYADSLQSGFIVKAPAKLIVRSDSAALTGLSAIDGVTPVAGDRILVARETPSIDNGIYVAASGAWSRAADMDVSADFKDGVSVFVEQGDVNADSTWVLITNNPITMDTTPVAFIQFSGLGQITAGNGLSKSGNTLDVNVGDGIYISSDAVAVDLSGTPGLQFESGKLAAKPDAARGLNKDASGLFVKHDGAKALAMDASNGLQVVADANYGLAIDGSAGLRVDLSATPGLRFDSGKLDAKNDPARGLGKDATGLFVKHDSSAAIAMDATDGLQVVVDPAKALAIDSGLGLQVVVDEQRGLAIDGTEGVYVDLATDPGLQFTGGKLDHKLVSADRLTKSASGLDVVGVPSQFKINGSAVSANVTHTNLNTLTAGGFTLTGLHGHTTVYGKLNASGDVGASKAVYIDGSGTVAQASCSATSTARVAGISYNVATSSGDFVTFITSGLMAPVGQTLTPGAPYYLGSSGELVEFSALVSGDRVVRLGYASTASSLQVAIQDLGAKA